MDEKDVLYLYYHSKENIFTDDDGHIIFNLLTIITSSDLLLFRYDHGYNCFLTVGYPRILCEIIVVPDEVCGARDYPEIDFGDDYERIERYEQAKMSGDLI